MSLAEVIAFLRGRARVHDRSQVGPCGGRSFLMP